MPTDNTPYADAARTIVTLDGPAGSGKSTTAREVARRLGYRYLDSGALYRMLTHALLDQQIAPERWPDLTAAELSQLGVSARPGDETLVLDYRGCRLGDELRTVEVTRHVSHLAQLPAVRAWLLDTQRDLGRAGRLVADGRDMGTVVFPEAGTKVFLEADLAERARRRLLDEGVAAPDEQNLGDEALRLKERDRADRERVESPLRVPDGATIIDTTGLSFDAQVNRVVELAQKAAGL